jgi:hypothetical protein
MLSFDSIVMRARESTPPRAPSGRLRIPRQGPAINDRPVLARVEAKRSAFAPRRFAQLLVLADTYHSIAGREDRILEGGVPQRSGDRSRRPVLPVGRRGQGRCRAAEGEGVRGRADVAGGARAGQLGLDPPRVDRHQGDVRQPTIPSQGQSNVARLALGVCPPRIGLPAKGPRAAGVRTPPGPSPARATVPAARRTAGGSVGRRQDVHRKGRLVTVRRGQRRAARTHTPALCTLVTRREPRVRPLREDAARSGRACRSDSRSRSRAFQRSIQSQSAPLTRADVTAFAPSRSAPSASVAPRRSQPRRDTSRLHPPAVGPRSDPRYRSRWRGRGGSTRRSAG